MLSNQPKLPWVQGLRALAALSIAAHHVQADAGAMAAKAGQTFARWELPWTAGVDIFFVISGFIMVYASAGLFGQRGASRTFLVRRITRIVPLYWLATSAVLAIGVLTPTVLNSARPGLAEIVASYFFVPFARADGLVQPVYGLGWTLNYEMFFYVLFAAAIVLARERAVVAVSAALAVIVAVGQTVMLPQPLAFWAAPIVLEFAMGMWIAVAFANGFKLRPLARSALAAAALVLLYADLSTGQAGFMLPKVVAHGLPAAMLVMAAAAGDAQVPSTSAQRGMVLLGDASYALYLIHPFVMRTLTAVFNQFEFAQSLGTGVYVVLALVLSVIAAVLTYRLVEQPMTRALRFLQPASGTRHAAP